MPRSTGSPLSRFVQFLREGSLDEVEFVLSKAKSIVPARQAEAKRQAKSPQRPAGKTAAVTTGAPKRKPRPSRAKSAAARTAGNGAASSPAGTDSTPAGNAATPGGSMSMQDQQRAVDEANQQ